MWFYLVLLHNFREWNREEENKVCHVNGYLTFQKDLLTFSFSQNLHDALAWIFVILCLMVRLGERNPIPETLSMVLGSPCAEALSPG